MAKWKNENGEWVLLSTQPHRYGWIDYKKQAEACKNCKHGPWGWGAGSCVDICQRGIIFILESTENGTVLYTAKINDDNKAEPDKKIIEACSLLTACELRQYLAEQGVAQYLP
jgi:NAD-dependent dihydropyrimidine dehydrogenase PreA subunit